MSTTDHMGDRPDRPLDDGMISPAYVPVVEAGRDIEADVRQAAEIARATPGIAEVRPYTAEESARLLEPWLGGGLALDALPVPRIIVVRLASGAPPDLAAL